MLELILCSLVTVLPDYLFRRYREGKRWGDQITFFTMWYELRWGITACLILTVSFITVVFYYHPSTTNAGPYFRTIPLLPEGGGPGHQKLCLGNYHGLHLSGNGRPGSYQ